MYIFVGIVIHLERSGICLFWQDIMQHYAVFNIIYKMISFRENVSENIILVFFLALSLTGFRPSSPVSDAGEVAPFGRYGCDEDYDASPSQVAESDGSQLRALKTDGIGRGGGF